MKNFRIKMTLVFIAVLSMYGAFRETVQFFTGDYGLAQLLELVALIASAACALALVDDVDGDDDEPASKIERVVIEEQD